ncbi:MAG: SlyX family protein [Polyangiaceae bacterium]|jgi:uncharacterized coiled-coil protein SlyX
MRSMTDPMARIVDLELRFMTLQQELRELSDVVASQQRIIEALRREAKRWRERFLQEEEAPGDDRPPHY